MTQRLNDQLVRDLEATGDYKVLRRLKPRAVSEPSPADGRVGLIIDTETTGLDLVRDEVIELGLLAFRYTDEGEVGPVIERYDGLREPQTRMSDEAIALTGITPELLQGRHLDDETVIRITESADLLIAHNAGFDRPMCERLFSIFRDKPWACSATEIPWKSHGFDGVKLNYLLTQTGYFNNGHRALDDCDSLLEVLDQKLSGGEAALATLLSSARQTRYRVWVQAPYDARERLKRRGYRWNPGENGRPRGWWFEGDGTAIISEEQFLQEIGLGAESTSIERQTAFDRYTLTGAILPRA